MKCFKCGNIISESDNFCNKCGNKIDVVDDDILGYICPVCKTPNPKTLNYCVKCGHWMKDTTAQATPLTKEEYQSYFNASSKSGKNKNTSRILLFVGIAILALIYITGSPDIKMVISLLIVLSGIISIIKPLRFLCIKTRIKGLLLFLFGVSILLVSTAFLPSTVPTSTNDINISIDEYKAQSKIINYEEIARETEKYIGTKAKYTGQVMQVQEIGNNVYMRVNVTKGEFNIYKDTLWINYKLKSGEKRILEKDIINIWGEIKGRKTYKAILGNQVTIPEVNAMYIEINKSVISRDS